MTAGALAQGVILAVFAVGVAAIGVALDPDSATAVARGATVVGSVGILLTLRGIWR